MKRFFNPQTDVVLSMEEEAILLDQAQSDITEATTALAAAGRADDTDAALSDTSDISDSIEAPTEVDQALANDVKDMAVAGTDIDVGELEPSISDIDGVAVESVADMLKSVWNSIVAMLEKAWKFIKNFYDSFFGPIESLQKRIEKMQADYAALKGRKAVEGATVTVRGDPRAFMVGAKTVKINEVNFEIDRLTHFAKELFTKFPAVVLNVGKSMAAFYNNFGTSDTDTNLRVVVKAVSAAVTDMQRIALPGRTSHDDKYRDHSEKFIGNFSVDGSALHVEKLQGHGEDELMALCQMNFKVSNQGTDRGMRFSYQSQDTGKNESGITYPVRTPEEYIATLAKLRELVAVMLDYKRGHIGESLTEQGTKVRKASEKAISESKADDKTTAMLRRTLKMNISYSRWASQPMVGAMQGIARNINHQLTMFESAKKFFHQEKPAA